MHDNRLAQPLAYVTGLMNQRLLLRCEYLIAENRILRSQVSISFGCPLTKREKTRQAQFPGAQEDLQDFGR